MHKLSNNVQGRLYGKYGMTFDDEEMKARYFTHVFAAMSFAKLGQRAYKHCN